MAYPDHPLGVTGQTLAVAAVLIIHTAAGAALVTGMNVHVLNPIERRTLTGINLPPPAPQPRAVSNPTSEGVPGKLYEPNSTRSGEPVADAMSWLVPAQPDEETAEPSGEIPPGSTFGSCACCDCGTSSGMRWERYERRDPYPIDIQAPALVATQVLPGHPATPTNDPATWIKPDDLPVHERYGGSDWMEYSLIVDRQGQVAGCEIIRRSVSSKIDAAVCQLISMRARFDPATGWDGVPVQGAYNGNVRWETPN